MNDVNLVPQSNLLFSVNDDLGKVVDYVHITGRDQDKQCGDYLKEQVELALGGSYIPKETIYWLTDEKNNKADISSLLNEVIYNDELQDLPSFSLRGLCALRILEDGLPRQMIDTVCLQERMCNDPDKVKFIEAFIQLHSKKADNLSERTVAAVEKEGGVLLFDDSGRGIQCMKRYLQYVADNYFLPEPEGTNSLGIYYFSTTNERIVKDSRQCPVMFTPQKPHDFIPQEGLYYPNYLLKDYSPHIQCSMSPDKSGYENFLDQFNLEKNKVMTDIACLEDIRKNGIDLSKCPDEFIHQSSFEEIRRKLADSYRQSPEHSRLCESLQKAAKDTAEPILRTEYKLPKPEKKETITRKNQIKL